MKLILKKSGKMKWRNISRNVNKLWRAFFWRIFFQNFQSKTYPGAFSTALLRISQESFETAALICTFKKKPKLLYCWCFEIPGKLTVKSRSKSLFATAILKGCQSSRTLNNSQSDFTIQIREKLLFVNNCSAFQLRSKLARAHFFSAELS